MMRRRPGSSSFYTATRRNVWHRMLLIIMAVILPKRLHGFGFVHHHHHCHSYCVSLVGESFSLELPPRGRGTCVLFAKKTQKKSKAKNLASSASRGGAAGGGGFGKTSTTTTTTRTEINNNKNKKNDDDYAIFPALDARTQATLVPAPAAWSTQAGDLPLEIQDRLTQIYGLPHFNNNYHNNHHHRDDHVNHQTKNESTENAAPPSYSSLESLLQIVEEEDDDKEEEIQNNHDENDENKNEQTMKSRMQQAIQSVPAFTDFRILHTDRLVLAIDDFMTPDECSDLLQTTHTLHSQTSPTVGTSASERAQRTSTTWYHSYEQVAPFVTKACALLGLPDGARRLEEVQTVRYQPSQQFKWHLDALGDLKGAATAGQRVATLLVYLTEGMQGGATVFRDLGGDDDDDDDSSSSSSSSGDATTKYLKVTPRVGTALLFFPAAGGIPGTPTDFRTLHAGEQVAADSTVDKWIAQVWLRAGTYDVTVGRSYQDPAVARAMEDYVTGNQWK